MARKRYKPEEIVAKLRQVDVLVSQGQNMVDAIRYGGATAMTDSARGWRKSLARGAQNDRRFPASLYAARADGQ